MTSTEENESNVIDLSEVEMDKFQPIVSNEEFSALEEENDSLKAEIDHLKTESTSLISIIKVLGGVGFCSSCLEANDQLLKDFDRVMDKHAELFGKKEQ